MFLVILLISSYISVCFCVDYCGLCETHTMCKYKSTSSDSCVSYNSVKMNTHLQTLIVNTHNKLRSNVALGLSNHLPTAADMYGLIWDNELAMIAQRWADTCVSLESNEIHDSCRKSLRFEVGQNVYSLKSNTLSEPNFVSMILNWYKEINNIDKFYIKKYVKNDYENCMQLIWSETRYIGCGHSSFQDEINGTSFITHRFVCNYGPSGNIEGKIPYKEGQPCSACENHFKCDSNFPGLCFEDHTLEVENRIRELVKTVNELITQRSKERMKYVKQKNGTIAKINDFSYTDVIIDYLAKALDYHKDHFHEFTSSIDESGNEVNNVFDVQMNFPNKSDSNFIPSENNNSGLIMKKTEILPINGIWSEGACQCEPFVRSSCSMSSVANVTIITISTLIIRLRMNDHF